jgi:hypothetical protein
VFLARDDEERRDPLSFARRQLLKRVVQGRQAFVVEF